MVRMVQAASKAKERELLARYGNFEAACEVRQMEEFVREHPERADELARAIYFHIDDHRWDWLMAELEDLQFVMAGIAVLVLLVFWRRERKKVAARAK